MGVIEFPKKKKKSIVLTKQMLKVIRGTLHVHPNSPLVVWSGRSRLGKTTTAQELVKEIDLIYNPENPDAFRSLHYEVGEITPDGGNEQKRGIRSLYHACIGRLDEGLYRTLPNEDLAKQLVHGLRRKNIQLILIDEAGTLSLDAIRGMVLVRDVAENEDWTLSLVFIGMDDLPAKMCAVPQIQERIHDWFYFEEYALEELFEVLRQINTHFAKLDLDYSHDRELVEFVHDKFGGLPGTVIPFLTKLNHRLDRLRERNGGIDVPLSLRILGTVYERTQRSMEKSLHASRHHIYKPNGAFPVNKERESNKKPATFKKQSRQKKEEVKV